MIRHAFHTTDHGSVHRASMFSEIDGLNTTELRRCMRPVAVSTATVTHVSDYSEEGEPVVSVFDNNRSSLAEIGMMPTAVISVSFDRKRRIGAVALDMSGMQVPAFDATLEGIMDDGSGAHVSLGTVRAGFATAISARTTCCFTSYGDARGAYGLCGTVVLRFPNGSFEGASYMLSLTAVGTVQQGWWKARRILFYEEEEWLSPVMSFPLEEGVACTQYDKEESAYDPDTFGDTALASGVSFNGRAVFETAQSRLSFAEGFLSGMEEASVSFWLRMPTPSSGAVLSCGSGFRLDATATQDTATLSFDGVQCTLQSPSSWHWISIVFSVSRHALLADGAELASVATRWKPFLSSQHEQVVFGRNGMYNALVGMEVRFVAFNGYAMDGALSERHMRL